MENVFLGRREHGSNSDDVLKNGEGSQRIECWMQKTSQMVCQRYTGGWLLVELTPSQTNGPNCSSFPYLNAYAFTR